MSARPLRVYGATVIAPRPIREALSMERHHMQCRAFVAATSQRAAADAMGLTRREWQWSGCETGNAEEVSTALSAPGVVFYATINGGTREFVTQPQQEGTP